LKRIPGPSGPYLFFVDTGMGAIPPGSEERFGFRMGGLISHAFFRPYAVTFDFLSMTLYLKKAAA
jgi:hypothetical protein